MASPAAIASLDVQGPNTPVPASPLPEAVQAPPPGAADAAVPVGVAVAERVLTTEELRRQQLELRRLEREQAREHFAQSLVSAADAIIGSATPVSLFLMFVGFWLHGFVTISLILKQARPFQTEPFVVCPTSHTLVQITQVLALSVAAVLGDQQMTFVMLGHTNHEVQPRRLFWLLWIIATEAIVVFPLCAPEIAPVTASAVPLRCHIGQQLPADADQEQRLSALQLNWTFLCASYLLAWALSIYFFLAMAFVVPRPGVFLAPLAALLALVTTGYLQYLVFLGRRAQQLIVSVVVIFDTCLADVLRAGLNAALGNTEALHNSNKSAGGLYGANVMWSHNDLQCEPIMLHAICWGATMLLALVGLSVYIA